MDDMDLYDYFAAKALQGMLANPSHPNHKPAEAVAQHAYDIAKAMMDAKENFKDEV
jgi:hypothetical protein